MRATGDAGERSTRAGAGQHVRWSDRAVQGRFGASLGDNGVETEEPAMPSNLTRRSLLSLAGAGAASAITMPAWATNGMRPAAVSAPTLSNFDKQIVSKISASRTLANLRHLSETIGQRYSGTPAENEAATFLQNTLRAYGYSVELQPFSVPDRRLGELSGSGLDTRLCWGVGAAARGAIRGTVTGPLVLAPSALPTDLPDSVDGAIVMRVVEGTEDLTTLAEAAAAKGAVAFVATRTDGQYPRQASAFAPTLSRDVSIPVVGVGQVQKYALLEAMPAELTLQMWLHTNVTSYNVLASVAGKQGAGSAASRDNVMVCAHYDSVIGAKGANDDGSGTVLTLELARIMRNLPTRANLQFALWGSEEVGLVGARHYVSQLDAAERARVRGVFNNDMVGTSWDPAERYWVLSYDGQPNVVNAQVLAAGERLGYRSQMSDVTQRGSSDHQAFQEQGMPSGNFSWRGVESPALLEPEYHSADDTIEENISMERLTVSMELIGCAAYALARQ